MITVREAAIGDVAAMARVQVDTKKAMYRSFYPAELLEALAYEKTAAAWRHNLWEQPMHPGAFSLLAESKTGEVLGVLIAGPEAGEDSQYQGEIYVLYVLPQWHGHGVGRALVAAAARRLLDAGITTLLIWVLAANPARGFYEALGGRLVRSRNLELHGHTLPEVAYGWEDLHELIGDAQ